MAVAWRGDRAYLAYTGCDGGYVVNHCAEVTPGKVEVRTARDTLDGSPSAELELSYGRNLAVGFEVFGDPYLVVGRTGPTPGPIVLSIADPGAPRPAGFVPLPEQITALAAVGRHAGDERRQGLGQQSRQRRLPLSRVNIAGDEHVLW